jgi:mRNA interferase MazF
MWLDLSPQAGHEQAGRRPVLVVSPRSYNERGWRLAVVCPVTNRERGQMWEVPIPSESGATGFILSDQLKSLGWRERRAEYIGRIPGETLDDVLGRIGALLGL